MSQLNWNSAVEAKIQEATNASVQAIAADLQGNVVSNYSLKEHDYWSDTPSMRGEPPAMISGKLAASVQVENNTTSAVVYTDAIYARVHELGLTIKAKSKLLTVPIGAAGKRFLLAANTGGWEYARRIYKTWMVPGKDTTRWVVVNKDAALVALKTEVDMPKRPAWVPAIEQTAKDAPTILAATWKKVFS